MARRNGRGGPSAAKRRSRQKRGSKEVPPIWWERERDYIKLNNPDFDCQDCGDPMWVMPTPTLMLRCNSCESQHHFFFDDKDGNHFGLDLEGRTCPVEFGAPLQARITTEDGVVDTQVNDNFEMVITRGTGRLVIDRYAHLLHASGELAHHAVLATRPPPCGDCGSEWTLWLSQEESHEPLLNFAKKKNLPVYQVICHVPWLFVHGFGGRPYRCYVCETVGVVRTADEHGPPQPDGLTEIVYAP